MMQRMQLLTEACSKIKQLQLRWARGTWIALDVTELQYGSSGGCYQATSTRQRLLRRLDICWYCTPARYTQAIDDYLLVPCVHWMMTMVVASTRQLWRLRRSVTAGRVRFLYALAMADGAG
jgi:hypothetical protein